MVKEFYYGDICTLTATPDECCDFLYWVEKNNPCKIVSYDNPFTFEVKGNEFYEAIFQKKKYHVYISTNNVEFSCISGGGEYDCGENVQISVSVGACHDVEWDDASMNEDSDISYINGMKVITYTIENIQNDVYVNAIVTIGRSSITVESCPEEGGISQIVHFQNGINHNINEYLCDGHLLYDSVVENACDNIDSYCKTVEGGSFECGSEITLIAIPNEGYLFSGWKNGNCSVCNSPSGYISTQNVYTTVVHGSVNYVACFSPIIPLVCYEVSFIPFETKSACYFVLVSYENQTRCFFMGVGETLRVPSGSIVSIYYYYQTSAVMGQHEIVNDALFINAYNETPFVDYDKSYYYVQNGISCYYLTPQVMEVTPNMGLYIIGNITVNENIWIYAQSIETTTYTNPSEYNFPFYDFVGGVYSGEYYVSGLDVYGCIQN